MKKIILSAMVIALATFSFTSCEDVPMPYDLPGTETGGGSEGGSEIVTPTGDGTEANPFNVAAAIAKCEEIGTTASTEKYYVKGKISAITLNFEDESTRKDGTTTKYGNATFDIVDDGSAKTFKCFQVYYLDGKANTDPEIKIQVGDEVVVVGPIYNYSGNTPETAGQGAAYIYSINGVKGEVTPPLSGVLTIAQALDAQGTSATVKGYIVAALKAGVSNSSGDPADIEFANFTGYNAIFLADSPTETDPAKMLCAKLNDSESPADLKSKVNLKDNPGNLGKELTLTGNLKACYTGLKGIRGITEYTLDGTGNGGSNSDQKDPVTGTTYQKVTTITTGEYVIAAPVSGASYAVATGLDASKTYGYLPFVDGTVEGSTLTVPEGNTFTFTATDGGFYIQDATGRYYYMTGTYNSFNLSNDVPAEGGVFAVTFDSNDNVIIKNVAMQKTVQYSTQYKSYGAYADIINVLPCLFKK